MKKMYWKNGGFYMEQDAENSRIEISQEYYDELFRGQESGLEIYDDNGYPRLRKHVVTAEEREENNKYQRTRCIEAYRNYQAAVNYGEFTRTAAVDAFIAALRAKDWAALQNVPPQLKYFLGECTLAESELTALLN